MIIGTTEIIIDNNNFSINYNTHPYHKILVDSFNLPYKSHFYAKQVCSLEDYIKTNKLSIQTAEKMLISINNQLNRLSVYCLAVSFFDINDIIVIDSNHFFFGNIDKIYSIINDTIKITQIYDRTNVFLPPEFKSNDKMPFTCHKNTGYYSLALIILFYLKQSNYMFSTLSNNDILDYYKSTKMYFILQMCLMDKPIERTYIIF
jgi:hypothetical protein